MRLFTDLIIYPIKKPQLTPSSLSDLRLIYCGKAGFGHISRIFSLNSLIRLKNPRNLSQTGLSLATIA